MEGIRPKLLLIYLFFFLASCNQMPYDLQIETFLEYEGNRRYQIHDKNDWPLIAEGFHIPGRDDLPKIEKLVDYSLNPLGIVIRLVLENKQVYYVAMKPKPVQRYEELDVTYTVFTAKEYRALKLKDDWSRIHGN